MMIHEGEKWFIIEIGLMMNEWWNNYNNDDIVVIIDMMGVV